MRLHPHHHMATPLYAFCFQCLGDHRALHSFPTRRSSDLSSASCATRPAASCGRRCSTTTCRSRERHVVVEHRLPQLRSEEHTSELQSRRDLVCRLLLEKKKKKL